MPTFVSYPHPLKLQDGSNYQLTKTQVKNEIDQAGDEASSVMFTLRQIHDNGYTTNNCKGVCYIDVFLESEVVNKADVAALAIAAKDGIALSVTVEELRGEVTSTRRRSTK